MTSIRHADHDHLQSSLGRSFVDGVSWPVSAAALAALVDMGLSDDRIGHYFHVDASEVRRQRERASKAGRASAGGRASLGGGHEGGVAPGKVAG